MFKTLVNTSDLLINRVGFRQTVAIKEYLKLPSDLVYDPSLGQIAVNALSEMFLKVESMANCLEFIEGYDIDPWSNAQDYEIGKKVKKTVNGREYVWTSIQASTQIDPKDPELDVDNEYWESYLAARLREYRESAAKETISQAIADNSVTNHAKELTASDVVYNEQTLNRITQKNGRFVGIEICSNDYMPNRLLEINKIFISVTDATPFNVYLYHSSQPDALQVFPMNSLIANTSKWYDLIDGNGDGICLDLYSEDYNQGGKFYIGFYESDLIGTYKNNELLYLQRLKNTKHFSFTSIEISASNLNGVQLPSIGEYYDLVDYNDCLPFNLRFQEKQSYYPLIGDNIEIFVKPYQYTLAINLLRDMMLSDRINQVCDNAQVKIDELLYGSPDNENNKGLVKLSENHMKKLLSDLNAIQDNYQGMQSGIF